MIKRNGRLEGVIDSVVYLSVPHDCDKFKWKIRLLEKSQICKSVPTAAYNIKLDKKAARQEFCSLTSTDSPLKALEVFSDNKPD